MLIPLAASIVNLADSGTVNSMTAVSDATNLTTDTFEALLGVFNADTLNPVSTLVSEINRFSGIGLEIANVSEFSAKLLNLGAQSTTTATDVAALVSDLNSLETQINTLTGDSGVDSLRTVFTNLAQGLQKAWDDNVVLGLPDVINLSAITIAEDGGLKELKDIAINSGKFAYIKAVGLENMGTNGQFAEGGYVSGPGTSTSDSIPAQLSNGEFVLKASTVKKLGVGLLNSLNSSGDISSVIASEGRFGDNLIAHINSSEAKLLKRLGGSGTRNPRTGMLEFFSGASSGANAYGGLFRNEEAALLYKAYKTRFATDDTVEAQNSKGYATVNDTNTYMTAKIDKLFNADKRDEPIEVTAFAPAVGNPGSQNRYSQASAELFGNMLADNYAATAQMMAVRDLDQSRINIGDNIIATEKSTKRSTMLGLDDKTNTALPKGNRNFKGVADSSLMTFSGRQRIGGAQYGDGSTTIEAMKSAVSAQNDLNSLFFDFYMLNDSYNRIPKNVKASQGALRNASAISDGEGDYFTTNGFGIDVDGDGQSEAYYSETSDRYGNVVSSSIREANSFDRAVESFTSSISDYFNSASGGLVTKSGALSSLSKVNGLRDSIPAMLQPGEFVLRKPAVDRMGVDTAVRLNSTGNVDSDVNVEVNVINNSSPVTPTIQQTRRENGKIVVDVILEDVRNNGPIRQAIRGLK